MPARSVALCGDVANDVAAATSASNPAAHTGTTTG